MKTKNYKIRKVANAIIYFLDNNVKYLGTTKIMKLLFFADKYFINETSKTMFNYSYIKRERGPVPTEIHSIIKSIQAGSEDIDYQNDEQVFQEYLKISRPANSDNRSNTEFQKIKDFDKRFFSSKQLEILNRVISEFKDIDKNEISEISHNEKCWKFAKIGEQIGFSEMADNKTTQNHIRETSREYENFRKNMLGKI